MTRMTALVVSAMLAATATLAQPAAPAAPAAARDPLLLPSDGPPPPLERMLAPPAPPAPGQTPGVAPADTIPTLDMAVAVELAQAAIAICEAQGLRVGAAVSDSAGNLRVGLTGNTARAGRIFTASRKNAAVIAYGKPTSAIQAMLRADPAARAALPPHMAVMPGGVPIMSGDKMIGALAVSGATSLQDEECANKALAQMAPKLK